LVVNKPSLTGSQEPMPLSNQGFTGCGKTHGNCHSEEPAGGPEHSEGRICICLKTRKCRSFGPKDRPQDDTVAAFFRSLFSPAPRLQLPRARGRAAFRLLPTSFVSR
jgi:hypothetical protein